MIKQIMKGRFEDDERTTTQASNYKKTVTVDGTVIYLGNRISKQSVTLDIWDTAGQEQYHALGPVYYRDAGIVCFSLFILDAAILVFDVTLPDTFEMVCSWCYVLLQVKAWVKEMNLVCQKRAVYVIAGNKTDLCNGGNFADVRAFAESINGSYIETSAKTGSNVKELLELVARSNCCYFFLLICIGLINQSKLPNQQSTYSISVPLLETEESEKKCCC